MKGKSLMVAGIVLMLTVVATASVDAAANVLQNGGIGQKSGDVTEFGVAVCNQGTQNDAQQIPVSVTANGMTVTGDVQSLNAGDCGYGYFTYAAFQMESGETYAVVVVVDPNHTFAENTDTRAEYSITVPSSSAGVVLGASTMSPAGQEILLTELLSMKAILESMLAKVQAL